MTASLPIQTTAEHLDKILDFLVTKTGWVPSADVRSNLGSAGDSRKLNTLQYLGIVERDGANVKLSTEGRNLARAEAGEQASIMRKLLKTVDLYNATLNWVFFRELQGPTKADVANYWIDDQKDKVGEEPERVVSDGAITFFRVAEFAGLGTFVTAGGTREARLDVDRTALEAYVRSENRTDSYDVAEPAEEDGGSEEVSPGSIAPPPPQYLPNPGLPIDPSVRVNVEVHIAADATPETVEEIFKNMRKYVLTPPETEPESG